MAAQYCVAKGRSLVVRRNGFRVTLKQNTVIEPGSIPAKELASHIKNGFIVRRGGEDESEPERLPMVKEDGSLTEAPPPPPGAPLSNMNLDPKKLKGKKLDALNVLIAERDEAHPPAASVEEAVKILSADFQG